MLGHVPVLLFVIQLTGPAASDPNNWCVQVRSLLLCIRKQPPRTLTLALDTFRVCMAQGNAMRRQAVDLGQSAFFAVRRFAKHADSSLFFAFCNQKSRPKCFVCLLQCAKYDCTSFFYALQAQGSRHICCVRTYFLPPCTIPRNIPFHCSTTYARDIPFHCESRDQSSNALVCGWSCAEHI